MAEIWHSLSVPEALDRLEASPLGLDPEGAARRLAQYGPNELQQLARISPLKIFLAQFLNVLVLVLIAAAVVSAALGLASGESSDLYDALLIAVIVVLNAVLGFIQEYRAERSLEALRSLAAPRARVVRGGAPATVPAREIVPGDLTVLAAGDRVAADCRIVEAASLRVNEAPLTGESVPVVKSTEPFPAGTFLADRRNMAYMGTTVEAGRGKALVVATGMATELGKIAGLVQREEKEETPLQKQLARLGKQIGILVLGISAIVFAIGFVRNPAQIEVLFLTAVSLAVAAIPEGLPAVVTITLALGLQRMLRRNALLRKLPAVEALGAASVICTDKTGTLTRGEMNVRAIWADGRAYVVEGEGYDPRGEVSLDRGRVDLQDHPVLADLLRCGALCNDATALQSGGSWSFDGDSTEIALLVAAMRAGFSKDSLESEHPRIAEVPFTSERKRMSTVHGVPHPAAPRELPPPGDAEAAAGPFTAERVLVKGAVERLLALCSRIQIGHDVRALDEAMRGEIAYRNQEMATRALRVLAFAYRDLGGPVDAREETLERDLVFLGLAGMMDAPRKDAIEAIRQAKEAGMEVVMITGDHKLTAMAVAREMGLLPPGAEALTGEELDRLSADELSARIESVKVYARVSPEHKLRIVDAWKRRGRIVAMTGDGVNDAPALKRSDLGIAMGTTGTDVAKESADMVLLDDNFASIVAAVEEGRGIYDNIRKFVAYLLSANVGEVAIMLFATILLLDPQFLPFFLPVQLLWINLVTDGLPALALGVDPYPKDLMRRPPRDPKEGVLSREVVGLIALVAGVLTVGTLGIFFLEIAQHGDVTVARTVAFTTLVFFELFLVFSMRAPRENIWQSGPFTNPKLVLAVVASAALQVLVVQVGALQPVFDTAPLSLQDWVQTILVALTAFFVVEGVKFGRRMAARRATRA